MTSGRSLLSARRAANQIEKFFARRFAHAAICKLRGAYSAIGVRLIASFPPAGPALLGTRSSGASPGIRVSRSGCSPANKIQRACAAVGQQKTLRSVWLGRVRKRTVDLASQAGPLPRAGQELSIGRRPFDSLVNFSCPYRIIWFTPFRDTLLFARARDIRLRFVNVKARCERSVGSA